MISFAVVKTIFSGKLGHLFLWSLPIFTGFAVTEAFMGQVIVAIIGAIPPTLAVIITLVVLLRGQQAMHTQMNSSLDKLIKAEGEAKRAEGVAQERGEERERKNAAAAAIQARTEEATTPPAKVEVVSTVEKPVITKVAK